MEMLPFRVTQTVEIGFFLSPGKFSKKQKLSFFDVYVHTAMCRNFSFFPGYRNRLETFLVREVWFPPPPHEKHFRFGFLKK